ncbi:kinase-like domain-containing protein [Halenospora varia]|nr:kinase-like domain-containing protein [Halenospora varia]
MKAMGKLKYAFYSASRIDEAVQEMELWQDRFLKRAEIHLRFVFYPKYGINTKQTDNSEQSSVAPAEIQSLDLQDSDRQQLVTRLHKIKASRQQATGQLLIPAPPKTTYTQLNKSPLWLATDKDTRIPLVEYRNYNGADAQYIKILQGTVRNIAKKLREANDTMHILQCQGFSDDVIEKRFTLHFAFPPQKTNPRSLRTLLADPRNARGKKHSLSDRLQLAQSIATAVLYVHSCEFVHKNIRPENIIIFDEVSDNLDMGPTLTYPYKIGQPYLAGYDGVRKEDAPTLMLETTRWEERVYLPAERLKDKEHRERFSWRHDVYSLGVVLLEIALWENFANPTGRVSKDLVNTEDPETLLRPILKQVPRLFGNKYGEAVMACFDMLSTADGMKEIEDEDGVGMGTTFISRVLDKLEGISL